MSAKSDTALTTDNNSSVVNQTTPRSITPAVLGTNVLQEIIDSKYNRLDDLLTLPPVSMTKAALAAFIGASALNLRTNGLSSNQWILVNDRADGMPLYVQSNGTNEISPFGIWVKTSKPLAVIMDYVNGCEGETNPFIAVFNETQNFKLVTPPIFADGTQGIDKYFLSDVNGKGTWYKPAAGEVSYFSMSGLLVSIASLSNGSTGMVVVSPSTTLLNNADFDNGGSNNGRLRYIGTPTKTKKITVTVSGTPSTTNDVFVFGIAKNGTVVTSSKILGSSNGVQQNTLQAIIALSTNDYVELYVGNTTAGRNITIQSLNIHCK